MTSTKSPRRLTITQDEKTALYKRLNTKSPFIKQGLMSYGFLPVEDMPEIHQETLLHDGHFNFSIRGYDEDLFYAYYAKFLKTWGDYVVIVAPPCRFANGEWSAMAWTTKDVWNAWYGK